MALNLQSLRRTLRYQARVTLPQLQMHLEQIAQADQQAEQKKQKAMLASLVCGGLAFFNLFLLPQNSIFVFTLVGLIAATIIFVILANYWGRLDVSDLRYELLRHLAALLTRDMAREAPLDISVDFSSPTRSKKKICTVPYAAYSGWKMNCFEDPWLELSGQFLDNTKFSLSLMEQHVSRYGWKRSYSGKFKFKRKNKFKGFKVQLNLRFPRKTYGAIALLSTELSHAIQLPPGAQLKQLKVNDHQLLMQVKVAGNDDLLESTDPLYQIIVQMLLSAYHALNLSKQLTQSS